MGGLNSGPGPGITLLIAIVLVLAQSALSAPLYEEDEGQESNSHGLAESHGCYYNFQHYNEGERILTNEPCLNCTCRNRMLMCYLRVCPFTKGIGQNCTVEKVPGQCCPIITCPEVPVQLLTSTTTEGIRAPGGYYGIKGTEVGHLDTNGCNIDGIFYPNGAQVPGSPEKPCELCYCIRNKTACIMQECALHVDGCRPVYEEGQCFPVRYQCDDSSYEEESTTTIRPAPTPGLIITTTFAEPLDCTYNNEVYEDGSRIQTEDPCEHCYCLKGKIACAVQECGAPLEKEGQNCTALPPAPGKCCPDSYQCDVTMTSQGLNYGSEGTTEIGIPSVADAGHLKDGHHPDQGIRTTEKPSYSTVPLDHITETVTPSKGVGEQKPTKTKPQELDKGTQDELTESHLQELHPKKPISTSDGNQKITFSVDNDKDTERPGTVITPEVGRPEITHITENESYDHTADDHLIDMSNEQKRPHPESVSHALNVTTKVPETTGPIDHPEETIAEHSDLFGVQPTPSQGHTSYNPTTNNVLSLKPQTSASDTKDPLLDKLHNIIQDVQAQVSDGKTEMPEQVDYETTMQSQTGHFTDKPEILSHLPQHGSQTSSSSLAEMGSTANGTSPNDRNDIINKLQGIIQGIYSHVTDSALSTRIPESSTVAGETQFNISPDNNGIIRPDGASQLESATSKKPLKPHKGSPEKLSEIHRPQDTETAEELEIKDKYSSKQTTEKSQSEIYGADHAVTVSSTDEIQGSRYPDISGRPQDFKYSTKTPSGSRGTEYPAETTVTSLPEGSSSKHPEKPVVYTPEGSIKLPLWPKPEGTDDEPYGAKYPETTSDEEEEIVSTEYPPMTDIPNLSKYPQETYSEKNKPEGSPEYLGGSGTTKRPIDKENYPKGQQSSQELPGANSSSYNQTYPAGFLSSEKHPELYPDGSKPTEQYSEGFKPSSQYFEAVETTEQNSEEISSSGQYLEKFKPGQQYSEGNRPTAQHPDRIKPLGQYPDKTKPAGFVDTVFGTEYPESVTDKPESETNYPASIRPSGQYPEGFTSGQFNEIKLTGIYPGESKPTEQYPEGFKPSGQYFENINLTKPEEFKPGQHYPDGNISTEHHPDGNVPSGQYTEKYKPSGQYPERLKPNQPTTELKPGQQYLEGSRPTGYYPEKVEPDRPTNISFQTNYPEGVTGKPDDESKYSENTGFVPSGQYPEKIKPNDQFSSSSKEPTGTKPVKSDGTPFEYSEGVTGKPSYDNKYPQSSKYPDKTGLEKPESSNSESQFDNRPTPIIIKPDNVSKYPERLPSTNEKPTGLKPYSTEYPKESGITDLPDGFTEEPEVLKGGKPGTTDWPDSTKYSQKNKLEHSPYGSQYNKDTGFTTTYETSTKYSESEEFKPDDQTKYPEEYRPGQKPPENYPEDSKYSEITGITDRPEGQTNYPEDFTPVTQYPESFKPDENLKGSTYSVDKNKLHSSTEVGISEGMPAENPNETGPPSRPKPEYDMKPSGEEYPEITNRPDFNDSGVTDLLTTFSKYPEKTKPQETPYEAEHPEEVTGKPDDGSKYSENFKPTREYSDGSKHPVTGRPEDSKRPYSSEYPDTDGLRPTQQYPEDSSRPQEQSKYPQKPEVENKPYDSETLDSTDRPNEQFTEHPDYNSVTAKPNNDDDDDDNGFEHSVKEIKKPAGENSYPEKQKPDDKLSTGENQIGVTDKPDGIFEPTEEDTITGRPQVGNIYSQKPGTDVSNVIDQLHKDYKPEISERPVVPGKQPQNKPESENELYGIESTERPTTPGLLSLEDKPYGTEHPEGVSGKPVGSSKYPNENKELSKRPQKPEYEYSSEGSTGQPDEENPEQNVTVETQGTPKYPEEAYAAQHPEKIKPPSADQLLETDNKPQTLGKYPEKIKPITELIETGSKYSEKSTPSSEVDSVTRPSNANKPVISGHSEQPGKPMETYESPEEITKAPHYTAQYPHKPNDRPSEMGKPQYPKESEYPEKIKPVKFPGKPESGDLSYSTEYPEKGRPDEYTVYTEEIVTDRPQDLNKYPVKSKPGSSDKPKDQTKYSTTSGFEEEPFDTSATNKPEDYQKYPESLKHPVKSKPGIEHVEIGGTNGPFDTEIPEEEIGKPGYYGQEPGKNVPTATEKLGMTYIPYEGSKNPGDVIFGTEYPNSETGTGRPEDFSPKPFEQKYPQGTEYSELPDKPEYQSKYPEGFTQTGQYTQKPYGSQSFPGTEYPVSKVTGRPEDHTKFPEKHYPGLTEKPQYSTKYPEGEKLHDSELSYGTEYPIGAPEYHSEHPNKFMPMGIHPQVGSKPQQSNKYPESSTQYPKEITDRTDVDAKYPESVTGLPGDHTKYTEGPKPTEPFFGAIGNIQGFTKHPEGDHSFNTKYPELGLTETSEDLTKHPAHPEPEGFYPEQPQVSEENSDPSTEYLNMGETDRPDISTKYPEGDKAHITEYPATLGITHEQSLTEHPEGSKATDSLYNMEHTYPSVMSIEHVQKVKPEQGRPHPENLTEHPIKEKATETYSKESERPEQEKPFENGVTVGPHGVTRYPDNMRPVNLITTVHGIEYPEGVTDKLENMKHSESIKYPDETGTEHPETNTDEPVKESKYPEEIRTTSEYPYASNIYSTKPKPGLENKPSGTEHPEDQMGFTKYPYESSTSKQDPETGETTVFALPDDLNKYPYGFKPGSGNYPENAGVNGETQGPMNYPQKKPSLEDEPTGIQYPDEIGKPESSTRYPEDKNPENIESFGMVATDKPQKNKYPEESEYSEITTPGVKYSQKPKPTGSNDIPYGNNSPETTDSEDDIGITETPEYLDQHPSTQYVQRPKPIESEEKVHGIENSDNITSQPEYTSLYPAINKSTIKYPSSLKPGSEDASQEYPEGIGFTEKPDYDIKYSDKTGYLTSRPFLGRPKPTGSDQSFVTEDPNAGGKTGSSTYPKKPQSGSEDDLYGNVYTETTAKHDSEDELHGIQYPVGSDKHPYDFQSTDKPYGTEYPAAGKPDVSGKPFPSTKYSETVEEQKITEQTDETEATGAPEQSSVLHFQGKPQETVGLDASGTEKYPDDFKPTDEYAELPERPHIPSKYPISPKPSASDGDSHDTGYTEVTEKSEDELFGTEYPKGTENTIRPEDEKYLENSKVTGKPHGIHTYPLRPKPVGFEDEPFGTEYPETTEKSDETSTAQGQAVFGKNPVKPKPVTKPGELYVTDKPVDQGKYPDEIKPEDDQFPSTEIPEGKKPEGYKPFKYPVNSHQPESVSENIYHSTEYPNGVTTQFNNENKLPEVLKPTEKYPDESGAHKKPYHPVKYPENYTEDGVQPYGTEYPEVIGVTKEPEDEANTEIFEVTRKTVSSSGFPTDEFSTEPGTAYLPQKGKLPNEKVPSSEHLNENSVPVVSEHSSSTETYFDFTDPTASSPAEGNLLNTHFVSHQDKPPSVDLTQEIASSSSSQDLITKYPEQQTTVPSDLHEPHQSPSKPIKEAKPTELDINAAITADDHPERPKPIVPGEGLHKVQDPNTNFFESSSFPFVNHKDDGFSFENPEIKKPEVLSRPEVSGIKKPDDEYQLEKVESTPFPNQHHSTLGSNIHKYPDSTPISTSDVKHPEGTSIVKLGDYFSTPGKHEDSTPKQPDDGNLETTDHPGNENTHLKGTSNTQSAIEYITYENYPEGISLPAEGFTKRPAQDSVSPVESMTDTSQDLYHPEKVSAGEFTGVQKTTTPNENDLINKLHNIISGIQSQVTDGKATTQFQGGYESTSPAGLPTEISQDYHLVTDKFSRPSEKPQEFVKFPHDQTPESVTTPNRHPIDGTFSSENEIFDQTTVDSEGTENQTNGPQFAYTSESGSTEHSVFMTSKGPEGIRPTEVGDNFSSKYPHQETATAFPQELKPVDTVDELESTQPEKPHGVKHSEVPIRDAITSHPDLFNPIPQHPTGELLVTEKSKPEDSTELPDTPTRPEIKYPEETTVQSSQRPSASGPVSFSQHPENISTTVSSVISVEHSGKPEISEGNHVIVTTPKETGSVTVQDRTTQIYQEIKGNQTPIENENNLIAQNNKTVPHNEDVNQKESVSVPTDKPLHVVYPTYYPDGVVTRIPGSKPVGETDKKVTVTPESTVHEDTTIKSTESSSTSTSKFGETHTIYETHTEISSGSYTTSPIVIIQEVHTEVHSERATTKTHTEGYEQQTTPPTDDNKPELSKGKPHEHRPEHGSEKFTKHPELTSQTPQIIFGRPAIIQPTGDQTTPESQTLQSHAGHPENEKFPIFSTHAEYPAKQPDSSTKPGFVTVTPIGIVSVTKESENIMHLYSSKDKHPTSASSIQHPDSFTTGSPVYPEGVKHTTEKEENAGFTEIQTNFVGTTYAPEIFGTRFPSRKTTQKPTDGMPEFQEGTVITPTQGIGEEYEVTHIVYPGVTNQPSLDISTEGLPTQDKTSEVAGFTTTKEGITKRPQGASFVPYKLINGNKVYYPEKESPERPISEPSSFDGYDRIPFEIINGTKFFYPNRVVTSQPEGSQSTTTSTLMGMYVPYKIINGNKIYYTQDKPQKPEKFDGLDYVPFEVINGTKIFYPEKVTTTPSPSLAMYVPFKIIDGSKVYYPKEAQEEPQNIPDEYDGFDYVPYNIVNGNKVFRPDYIPSNVPTTTEHLLAMYVPYKLLNGNRVYYPKDAQTKPESVPEEYDGFDLVPYEVVNGTKLFYPDSVTTQTPEQVTAKTPAMFVPYKIINGTKVYFPKYAQNRPTHSPEGFDGFDYLPYEDVNGTKVFRPERVTPKPELTSTPAFYSNGMFVPFKIINDTKVFFPKDAQHKPRPLKPGYDGVQYLPYDVVNGTKVFYPERATTPTPIIPSALYVPYKLINGTKVYYADKATENPEKIPEGYEGFDYVPYEIVGGNKLFYPDRLKPTMGMYVPYKKVNGSKVYYPKDSSEKRQPVPEGYDGVDYVPYEIINGTKVFYPDRVPISQPTPVMYVPYKMVNGTKVYYPKDAQHTPYPVTDGYDGLDSLPYEVVNGTNVFHPESVTQRPTPAYPQGMFVPYKMINGTKVYYPQEAHKRPHPLSDEYAGLDYIPYEVVNGTKVFHPERLTPSAVPAMYVPYKLVNGTKVFYPKHAQHNPQQILPEYDGFDYVPYEIINGSQVFYPNRIPNYQGMYVPYKIINGEKVFYPKLAQHNPSDVPDGYDGFEYLPYESINRTNIVKPTETVTETPFEQAMYVPYKVVNGTKIFYAEYAQYKPYLIPQGFDGFDYIPYEIVNGTKVFDPDLVATPDTPYKPAMYVPFKIIDGKKVYYPKHAQNKPHLVPEGYDGFDYIPYEIVNGNKIFDPEQAVTPGSDFKPGLYVPYKMTNGIKVYQPKLAQHKPSNLPQGYDGFDYLPYDVVNGNKVFYPEQSTPLKQAMYVPFKYINGTKVFYPKYAQHVPVQTPEGYDGLEYIPYEIVKGDKVFHPEQAIGPETPFRKAMYVPYKVVNGTKIYYPKNSHYNPYLIPQGYDGFDYIPYEMVNGNKVFHPEQAILPETSTKQAMYVPFRVVNGTKVYYPKYAQLKPQLISENFDGFDYLSFRVVNGTKVFDPQVPSRPTYLQGMYVPYKSINNTKVFYPKDAHNKPSYTPEGYDGADYVPYELLNNTKMFYPELISTAQPGKYGSTGVYVPFKVVNNKKVFYPKEATPFPPTVRYPYDGVAFVPHKMLGEASPSEIVYVDDNETFKPHQPPLRPGQVPGEGSCYINNKTFANNTEIPPVSPCQASCICVSSVVRCVRVKCPSSPENKLDCSPVYREGSCCPTYVCGDSDYEYSTTTGYSETRIPEFAGNGSSGYIVGMTTPFAGYGAQKRPFDESGDVTGDKKPEVQAPSEEYHLHKPPKPKPEHESLEPYDNVEGQLTPDEDYDVEDEEPYGPGTCRYAGKVYVSAQQIPRDDPCDFCFCFRSDIICLQQSCPPPIPGCRDEPIQGFCCPRYECHVKMATMINVTSTTTTTTTTLPPHFFPHAFKGSATKTGCFVQGRAYRVGQAIPSASGPCMDCICGGNGRMKCEPKVCTPEPMIRKMISPSENVTSPSNER